MRPALGTQSAALWHASRMRRVFSGTPASARQAMSMCNDRDECPERDELPHGSSIRDRTLIAHSSLQPSGSDSARPSCVIRSYSPATRAATASMESTSGLINIDKAEIGHSEEGLSGFASIDGRTLGIVRGTVGNGGAGAARSSPG